MSILLLVLAWLALTVMVGLFVAAIIAGGKSLGE
jgi:hypothetical protein